MTRTTAIAGLFVALLWFPAVAGAMEGQRPLFQRQTPHFTIVYPAQAEAEADRLQALAEGVYDEVIALVPAPAGFHLPVVINPGTDRLNGYFTPFPSARIVLEVAPISPNSGFASYDDVLRQLFLHELTHAVSLLQKDGFSAFLSALMGDVVSPALLQAPGNFVEGVTVAAESRGGFGRANDPRTAAVLQQALLEDRFPSFLETTGAGDRYPWSLWYTYGGWFSRWLLETEGGQKYADLWRLLGSNTGIHDWLWFSGAFRTVYGTSIDEAWGRFQDWMRPKGEILPPGPFLDQGFGRIRTTAARGGRVWVARNDGAYQMDLAGDGTFGPLVRAFPLDASVVRLDPDADGRRILVSQARQTPYGGAAWTLRVWDAGTGSFEPRAWPDHLGEAAWLPGGAGLVAVRARGYTLDLVRVTGDGVEVLFAGTSDSVPSQPCPQADGSLLFLLQVKGENRIARWTEGRVWVFEAEGLENVRELWSEGNRAWFTWDADRTLPKLGILGGATLSLYPSVSGGVHLPLAVGETVVYRGDFTRGERLVASVPGTPVTVQGTWSDHPVPGEPMAMSGVGTPYNALGASLVPGFRYPLVKLDLGGARPVRGGGLGFESSDPAGYFSWSGSAQWLPLEGYLDTGLSLALGSLPLDLSFAVVDSLKPREGSGRDVREASAMVSVGQTQSWDRSTRLTFWSLQTGVADRAPSDGTDRVYGWAWQGPLVPLAVLLGYQDLWSDLLTHTRAGWAASVAASGDVDPASGPWSRGAAQARVDLWFPWLQGHLAPRLVVPTGPDQALMPGGVVDQGAGSWSRNDLWRVPSSFEDRTDLRGEALAILEGDVGVRVPVGWALGMAFYLPSLEFRAGWQALGLFPSWGQAPAGWLTSVNAVAALTVEWTQVPAFETLALSVGARVDQPLGGATDRGAVVSPWVQAGTLY